VSLAPGGTEMDNGGLVLGLLGWPMLVGAILGAVVTVPLIFIALQLTVTTIVNMIIEDIRARAASRHSPRSETPTE
jgi:hypothetical protein